MHKVNIICIHNWSDAICNINYLRTFADSTLVREVRIAEACDNPNPDFEYRYSEYKLINNNTVESIRYSKMLPDSLFDQIDEFGESSEKLTFIYDTVVNIIIIDDNGIIETISNYSQN